MLRGMLYLVLVLGFFGIMLGATVLRSYRMGRYGEVPRERRPRGRRVEVWLLIIGALIFAVGAHAFATGHSFIDIRGVTGLPVRIGAILISLVGVALAAFSVRRK